MKGNVTFTIETSGEFEFEMEDSFFKKMTFEEFKEWLYKYYIWDEDYMLTEERVIRGYITFDNGKTIDW